MSEPVSPEVEAALAVLANAGYTCSKEVVLIPGQFYEANSVPDDLFEDIVLYIGRDYDDDTTFLHISTSSEGGNKYFELPPARLKSLSQEEVGKRLKEAERDA